MELSTMKYEERIVFALRELYRRFGYMQYKMRKFEEYDLYARNKDFLPSDIVITFTYTNGALMALKPDVTLSIVRSGKDGGGVQKVYYNENVYRVSRGSASFREIRQAGLECIGSLDAAAAGEVLILAARSRAAVSPDYVLDIAHLGILSAVLDRIASDPSLQEALLAAAGEKNLHGIRSVLRDSGIPAEKGEPLIRLLSLPGRPEDALPEIGRIAETAGAGEEYSFFRRALSVFSGEEFAGKIRVDFSVTGDRNYYNGLIFKGFIAGIPSAVLSGGQYDHLMRRLGKKASAAGFAVYLDSLEQLDDAPSPLDTDILLLYGDDAGPDGLMSAVEALQKEGYTVRTGKLSSRGIRAGRVGVYEKGGITWQV